MTRPTEAFEATGGLAAGQSAMPDYDVENVSYYYFFAPELYREWHWTERCAAQPEIVRYPNCVTDKHDVRRHTRFSPRMTSAAWALGGHSYLIKVEGDEASTARFLVMAAGQLSRARKPG